MESLLAKGAIPLVSSQTPDNIWDGDVLAAAPRFVAYAQEVAGNTSTTYIDHFDYVAQGGKGFSKDTYWSWLWSYLDIAYEAIGETTVDTFYPVGE